MTASLAGDRFAGLMYPHSVAARPGLTPNVTKRGGNQPLSTAATKATLSRTIGSERQYHGVKIARRAKVAPAIAGHELRRIGSGRTSVPMPILANCSSIMKQ